MYMAGPSLYYDCNVYARVLAHTHITRRMHEALCACAPEYARAGVRYACERIRLYAASLPYLRNIRYFRVSDDVATSSHGHLVMETQPILG